MATIREVIDGLEVLAKYDDGSVSAEHDILYAGSAGKYDPTPEDVAILEKAGWFWDDECDSWARFT